MKIQVNAVEKATEKPFPKLMVSNNGIILLAFRKGFYGIEGTYLCNLDGTSNCSGLVGMQSNTWNDNAIKDFNGSITLEND